MKNLKYLLFVLPFLSLNSSAAERSSSYNAITNPKVIDFINTFSKKGIYSKGELENIFKQTKIEQKKVKKQQSNQAEKKLTWSDYQKRVVTNTRITAGKVFLKANSDLLQKAEDAFNVNKEVIVAILGVETNYGFSKGKFRAIDSLSTLSFEYYPRSDFFRKELESLLILSKKNNTSPFEYQSSWAGAIGYPQFIPSSILAYGIDFDKDGKIDLSNSIADAIGSIGNYLNKNKFKKNTYYYEKLNLNGYDIKPSNGLKLDRDCNDIKLDSKYCSDKFKIFKLDDDYYVGSSNFYAITMYNRSNLYASAVLEIAKSLSN